MGGVGDMRCNGAASSQLACSRHDRVAAGPLLLEIRMFVQRLGKIRSVFGSRAGMTRPDKPAVLLATRTRGRGRGSAGAAVRPELHRGVQSMSG